MTKPRHIVSAALGATVAVTGLLGATGSATAADTTVRTSLEKALVREMNHVRVMHDRTPLRTAVRLTRPARAHSGWLASTGAFQHDGPGGAPFWKRIQAAGYPRDRTIGENIALVPGCSDGAARRIVQLWMDSPPHRANLLSPRFRYAGAGVVSTAGCDVTLATADYGG